MKSTRVLQDFKTPLSTSTDVVKLHHTVPYWANTSVGYRKSQPIICSFKLLYMLTYVQVVVPEEICLDGGLRSWW